MGLIQDLSRLPIWRRSNSIPDEQIQWISLDDAVYQIFYTLSQTNLEGTYTLANPDTISLRVLFHELREDRFLSFYLFSKSIKTIPIHDSPPLYSIDAPFFDKKWDSLIEIIYIFFYNKV